MPDTQDVLFRSLADPTRRAIFERLCREGETTVGALTARAGVSQPVVSKHLGVLKSAGLVRDRHEGRHTHYSAQLGALAPLMDWTKEMTGFWQKHFDSLEDFAEKDRPMTNTGTGTETRSVIIEREVQYPPEKIWRALTQPHLIGEWLMKSDFRPVAGHAFRFTADWGSVDCRVQAVEPNRTLSYTWDAMGLESVVTWTLTPTGTGTRLRMEQAGFRPNQQRAYQGAQYGWQQFLTKLGQVLSRLE